MKKRNCCVPICKHVRLHDCNQGTTIGLSDAGTRISVICSQNDKVEIYRPDSCDTLTSCGMRVAACDFALRKITHPDYECVLIELKSGSWSFTEVRKQFEGGFQTLKSLGVSHKPTGLYVASQKSANGSTQALGGLQTYKGLPIKRIALKLEWS